MTDPSPRPTSLPQQFCWPALLPSYLFLALFAAAATQVTQLNALGLGLCSALLALPMAAALWHQASIHRLIRLQQFQPGRSLHRWGSRRSLGIFLRALLALALSAASLLQSVFFGPLEWLLLGFAPVLFQLLRAAFSARFAAQFTARVYALRWSFWATQGLLTALLVVIWVLARYQLAEPPTQAYADRIHTLQSGWAQTPSGSVKWALDAGAWGQASIEALDQHFNPSLNPPTKTNNNAAANTASDASSHSAPHISTWRLLLVLLMAPISVFSHLALSLSGLSLPRTEIRRTFGESLTADESPPPVTTARVATWAAVGTIALLLLFQLLGPLDQRLRSQDSPFALTPQPACDLISGVAYRVGSSQLLNTLLTDSLTRLQTYQGAACRKLTALEVLAERDVDHYLDWYFSLGAEWARLAALLTGDIENLLQAQFKQSVLAKPEALALLNGVQADYALQWAQLTDTRSRALALLAENRLLLAPMDCKRANPAATTLPWATPLDGYQLRLASGAGAGLVAGAISASFAAKLSVKAISKASMKSAAKVLAKAVAKKAAGKTAAAAAGAAIGTVMAPGIGTLAGAAIGIGMGLTIGVGIDLALLAAEEQLTRADMKKDLLSAVHESLQPYRDSLACP